MPTDGELAHAHAYFTGYASKATFLLAVRKAQHLDLSVSEGGPTVVMINYANGQSEGAPGGLSVNVRQSQDLRIVVTEHTMGEPWKGPMTLDVKLH